MVKTFLPVTQALSHRWKDESLCTLWDKNEKNQPLEEKSTQNVSAGSQGTGNICELTGSWCCSGTFASPLRLLPASQRSWTIRMLKSCGRFTQACSAQHRAEFQPCCTWRMKTRAKFYPQVIEISPVLKVSPFREGRPHCLLPTGWTNIFPT